jgi:hypothetical protein
MAGASEPLPILIGLSGKRDLRGREVPLRRTLEDAFDRLDAEFPHAPKVLVTGLAEGADIFASELARTRPAWRVAGLLPMELETYAATMTDDDARQRLRDFIALPRVSYRDLRPLDSNKLSAELAGRSTTSLHYEQLALWLVEHCAVLLVVLPSDEQADRPGGTHRVVRHASEGEPDALGRAVIEASTELALHPVLEPPSPRPVWRIDLTGEAGDGKLPSAILLPDGRTVEPRGLARWFVPAGEIDLYNDRAGTDATADWPAARPDGAALLASYRTTLSNVQGGYQVCWKRCIWGLGVVFVLAVMLLEAFAKLGHGFPFAERIYLHRWGMPAYVIILILAVGLYLVARALRWQPMHEDYRAVNEMLRVQRMWWQAGLNGPMHRADYYYLSGVGPPFANIRNLAASFATWARIVANRPAEDWRGVQGQPTGYLVGQRRYFHLASIDREFRMYIVSVTSWFCSAVSFGLALWLAVWLGVHFMEGEQLRTMARVVSELRTMARVVSEWSGGASVPLALLFTACVFVVRLLSPTQTLSLLQTIVPGVLLGGLTLSFALYDLGDQLTSDKPNGGNAMVLTVTVALLAIAGGVRFIADKLAWEAEALAYHEAYMRFSHAEKLLADIDATEYSDDEKKQRKQEVLRELGRAALAENEAWLRAHRERPIEPVLGG